MFRERCGRGDRQKVVGLVATRCLVQVGPRMSMRLRSQAQKIVRCAVAPAEGEVRVMVLRL